MRGFTEVNKHRLSGRKEGINDPQKRRELRNFVLKGVGFFLSQEGWRSGKNILHFVSKMRLIFNRKCSGSAARLDPDPDSIKA
jgi:hypothetical protein